MALDIRMSHRLSWFSVARIQQCGLGLDSHEIRYIHCAYTLFAGDKMKKAKLFQNRRSQQFWNRLAIKSGTFAMFLLSFDCFS